MGRHKTNTFRQNIMLSEENSRLARSRHGSISKSVNMGLELLIQYSTSVYMIRHKVKPICFVGIFFDQDVKDVQYHFVHDLGSNSLGYLIRKEGIPFFDFKVIGKFKDLSDARFTRNMFRKAWEKKGFSQDFVGLDDSEL